VPAGLETLGHLRELIMDGNNFSSIPPSLLQLRRLTVLVLSYNRLVTLALAHITWCAALVSC
jgi:Leucine-rich repeat (LRR) protein